MKINIISSGSHGNAYIISDYKTKLLLDCGIPYKKIQIGGDFKLHELSACLISHEH